MQTLVSVNEFDQLENPLLFDCRYALTDPTLGQSEYEKSHIPGAIHADLGKDLSGDILPGVTGRHPLPSPGDFSERVRRWGLMNGQQAIIYDDANGAFAARLWWMLRWLGHGQVAVLDGGLKAWIRAGKPLTDEVTHYHASEFKIAKNITRQISAEDLLAFPGLITDARDRVRFNGTSEPIDPVAGHIPNARCLPFVDNLGSDQTFKAAAVLKQRFDEFGVPTSESTVCYCGSGVTATHNILALVHAGYPEPTLYPGSWSEWITDPERPVWTNE